MDLRGRRVLVVGLGKSGRAAATEALRMGAQVLVSDSGRSSELERVARDLEESGAKVRLGTQTDELIEETELVLLSPGVPGDLPLLERGRRLGVPIWSELEFAFRLARSPIIAVTGTNGKSTTVQLIGELLRAGGIEAQVAGNIGWPLVEAVAEAGPGSLLVVEVSSFQLEEVVAFRPWIGVLLNIAEDHLDRHRDLETYLAYKARLFARQGPDDVAMLSRDDASVWSLAPSIRSRLLGFGQNHRVEGGVYVEDGWIVSELEGDAVRVAPLESLRLPGRHNLQNALAAIGVSILAGVEMPVIARVLRDFRGLEHRLELVRQAEGVSYFDDSKATNPHATLWALNAFEQPVILLLGGKNKGMDFTSLREGSSGARRIALFGEAGEELEHVFAGDDRVERFTTLEQAVRRAAGIARPGDVVLLSPACASLDSFRDYRDRGDAFQRLVKEVTGDVP